MRVSAMAKGVSTDYDPSPPPSPKPTHNYYSIQIIIQASSAHPKPTNTIRLRICGSASTTRQSYCGCQQEEQLRLGNPHSKMAEPYRTQQIRERGGGSGTKFPRVESTQRPRVVYLLPHHQNKIIKLTIINAQSITYDDANCLRHLSELSCLPTPTMPEQMRPCSPQSNIGHDKYANRGEGGEQHFQGCWRMQQRKGMGGESNCNSNTVWQGCDDPTRDRIRDCVRAPQYRGCA